MIKLHIPVEPMGAVRMTGRGKYIKPAAQRYLAYKSRIQWLAKQQIKGAFFPTGALEVRITFFMPIPKSWSNVKKADALWKYHTKKPDADNMVKGVFDALNKIAWNDDNQVAKVTATKVYGDDPGVEVLIRELKQ